MNARHALLVLAAAQTLLNSPLTAAADLLRTPPDISACVQRLVDSKMDADLRAAVLTEDLDNGTPHLPEATVAIVQERPRRDATVQPGSSAL